MAAQIGGVHSSREEKEAGAGRDTVRAMLVFNPPQVTTFLNHVIICFIPGGESGEFGAWEAS